MEVDVWTEVGGNTDSLEIGCRAINYVDNPASLSGLDQYDAILYHLGNSAAHNNMYPVFLEKPGIVVLHDFVLHHFFAAYYLEHLKKPDLYVLEMEYNYGSEGRLIAHTFLRRNSLPPWQIAPLAYPLNQRILDKAQGVIVHSRFVRDLVSKSARFLPIRQINLFARIVDADAVKSKLRRKYRLPEDKVVVASLGFITPAKRMDVTLAAINHLGRDDVLFLLVGESPAGSDAAIRKGLRSGLVRSTGYVDAASFEEYMQLIDICVNLRWPTMGETSASLCRALGAGKPCIVSDVGWFAELPDHCVAKVAPGDREEEMLSAHLRDLIEHPAMRETMGANARRYIAENHEIGDISRQYAEFIEQVTTLRARQESLGGLVRAAAVALADLGVTETDTEIISSTARHLATLGVVRNATRNDK
jgi:glycosyltransferase involved in cell wall biosynthesis